MCIKSGTILLTGSLFFSSSTSIPKQNLDEKLVNAVRECDASKVQALLKQGADVNAKDSSKVSTISKGETVLAATVETVKWSDKAKCTEVARILIGNGADVNTKDRWGWPVLTWAA